MMLFSSSSDVPIRKRSFELFAHIVKRIRKSSISSFLLQKDPHFKIARPMLGCCHQSLMGRKGFCRISVP
jgi:hypothetical protein